MAGSSTNNNICLGLVAHVDAGKTTLAESLLYLSGRIKKPGRVDHKDAYRDMNEMERERGITIFSKQADINIARDDTIDGKEFEQYAKENPNITIN